MCKRSLKHGFMIDGLRAAGPGAEGVHYSLVVSRRRIFN